MHDEFLSFMCLQCVGRALRGKTDYGIMIFADKVCMHVLVRIVCNLFVFSATLGPETPSSLIIINFFLFGAEVWKTWQEEQASSMDSGAVCNLFSLVYFVSSSECSFVLWILQEHLSDSLSNLSTEESIQVRLLFIYTFFVIDLYGWVWFLTSNFTVILKIEVRYTYVLVQCHSNERLLCVIT